MAAALIQFIGLSAVVVIAAIVLTQFADLFARTTRLGHLIVGGILLASATSLPELSMNWALIRLDLPDIAVGGLLGSSLFNLAILAIADLSHKARGTAFSRKSIESALPGVVSIAMTAVVGIAVFVGDRLGAVEVAGVGIFSFALLLTYLIGLRLIYHDQLFEYKRAGSMKRTSMSKKRRSLMLRSVIGFSVCAIIILAVAPQSAAAAGKIAELSGLGDTFTGTTFVAMATSIPELVTCIAAVRIGAIGLAIGNIFGSNTFNMILLIPLDIGFPGSLLGNVSINHLLTCLFVVLVTATVIIGQLYRVENRKFLVEPDAALVLILVTISLVLIYFCG
jgi:cation:H+ antiporter